MDQDTHRSTSSDGFESDMSDPVQRRPPSLWRIIVSLIVVIGLVGISVLPIFTANDDDSEPGPRSDDPVDDLLGWLPTGDGTQPLRVAAWFGVESAPDGERPTATVEMLENQRELGLAPFPRTLGTSDDWRETYGWGATDVVAWAASGVDGAETVVMDGRFDAGNIEELLVDAGYRATDAGDARVFTRSDIATPGPAIDGDAPSAALVVALVDDRIITGPDTPSVERALATASGRQRSLLADPRVANVLANVSRPEALMILDAALVAGTCAGEPPGRGMLPDAGGRVVALAYLPERSIEPRRTWLLVGFAPSAVAPGVADRFEVNWLDSPVVAVQGVVAPVSSLGTVSDLLRFRGTLVVEFTDGRGTDWSGDWVPAAVRYAEPVCTLVDDPDATLATPVRVVVAAAPGA